MLITLVLISFMGTFVSSEDVTQRTGHGIIQYGEQNTSGIIIPTLMISFSTTTPVVPLTTSKLIDEREKVEYGENLIQTEENERYNYFNVPDEERGNRVWGDPNFTNKHRSN